MNASTRPACRRSVPATLRTLGNAVLVVCALSFRVAADRPGYGLMLLLAGFGLRLFARDLERGTRTGLMLMIAGIAVLAAAVPNFSAARLRANQRACFANQRTIVGAIEMYRLDKDIKEPLKELMPYVQRLREGGYLRNTPTDPGSGPDSGDHYVLTTTGNGIRCTVHGSIP